MISVVLALLASMGYALMICAIVQLDEDEDVNI